MSIWCQHDRECDCLVIAEKEIAEKEDEVYDLQAQVKELECDVSRLGEENLILRNQLDALLREHDSVSHEAVTLDAALREAEFRAIDLGQRFLNAAHLLGELGTDPVAVRLRAALKLGDD